MRFIGVDMASQPVNTGLVVLEATDVTSPPTVVQALGKATDADILAAIPAMGDHVLGIDAPLGWPARFREQMGEWTIEAWDDGIRNDLIYRATDRYLSSVLKLGNPLSVSANLIAIPAMRTRALLTRLGITALDGSEGVYETYPAASLRVWDLPNAPYKGKNGTAAARQDLLKILVDRWGIRDVDPALLAVSDHVLDALICALTVREVIKHGTSIPPEYAHVARQEGWIHVPKG